MLAIVENVDQFYMLGTSINNAPGEVLDKVHLKVLLIPYNMFHSSTQIGFSKIIVDILKNLDLVSL